MKFELAFFILSPLEVRYRHNYWAWRRLVDSKNSQSLKKSSNLPPQRKTTLKWGEDGELSAIDMARILDRLEQSELTECDITCSLED